jgi:uncharacterized protein (TIGR02421 family)
VTTAPFGSQDAMQMQMTPDAVNAATQRLIAIDRDMHFTRHLTPANLAAERARFLSDWRDGSVADPQFVYPDPPLHLLAELEDLGATLPRVGPWAECLTAEVDALVRALAVLRTRDPELVTAYAAQQYGVPDDESVAAARDHLEQHPDETPAQGDGSSVTWSAEQARSLFQAVLDAAALTGWTAECTTETLSRMSVAGSRNLVRINAEATFGTDEIRRLVVHEIGTHVARTVNGRQQEPAILAHGISGYMATEEGLAVWHEHRAGVSDIDVMRTYALRVIGCHAARTSDFTTVFETLIPWLSPAKAFAMTMRIKRGLTDTTAPGGSIKDHVYLAGYLQMQRCIEQRPDDHDLLLATKWPAAQLPMLRRLRETGALKAPVAYPETMLEIADRLMAAD